MAWKTQHDHQSFRGAKDTYTGDGYLLGELFYAFLCQGIRDGDSATGSRIFGKFVASGLYQAIVDVGLVSFAISDIGEGYLPIFTKLSEAYAKVGEDMKASQKVANEAKKGPKTVKTRDIGKQAETLAPMFEVVSYMCRCPKSDRARSEFAAAVFVSEPLPALTSDKTEWDAVDALFTHLIASDRSQLYNWAAQVYVALSHIADRAEWTKQWTARWNVVGKSIKELCSPAIHTHWNNMKKWYTLSLKAKDTYAHNPIRWCGWMLSITLLAEGKLDVKEMKLTEDEIALDVVEGVVMLNPAKKPWSERNIYVLNKSVCHFGTSRGRGTDTCTKFIKQYAGAHPEVTSADFDLRLSAAPLPSTWDAKVSPCLPEYLDLTNRAYPQTANSKELHTVLSGMHTELQATGSLCTTDVEDLPERYADFKWTAGARSEFADRFGFGASYFATTRPKKPTKVQLQESMVDVSDLTPASVDAKAPEEEDVVEQIRANRTKEKKDQKSNSPSNLKSSESKSGAAAAAAVSTKPVATTSLKAAVVISKKESKKKKTNGSESAAAAAPPSKTEVKAPSNSPKVAVQSAAAVAPAAHSSPIKKRKAVELETALDPYWQRFAFLTMSQMVDMHRLPLITRPSPENSHRMAYVSDKNLLYGAFNTLDPVDASLIRHTEEAHTFHTEVVGQTICFSSLMGFYRESRQVHRVWVAYGNPSTVGIDDWGTTQHPPTSDDPYYRDLANPLAMQMYPLASCPADHIYRFTRGVIFSLIASLAFPLATGGGLNDFYLCQNTLYRTRIHSTTAAELDVSKKHKGNPGSGVVWTDLLFSVSPSANETKMMNDSLKTNAFYFQTELELFESRLTSSRTRCGFASNPIVQSVLAALRKIVA